MEALKHGHMQLVLSRVPKDVRELMIAEGLILAGGFVRAIIAGERPNDIDLFCAPDQDADRIMTAFALKRGAKLHKTENALTVLSPPRLPVQLITRWRYATPEIVNSDFDFTIAQASIWGSRVGEGEAAPISWKSSIADTFYADLASRQLVYTMPMREEAAGGSILRVRKFLRAGYQITAPSLAAVMARLLMKVRERGMAEDETGARKVLTGLLREVDPLLVVDGIDLVDESEFSETDAEQ